VQRIDEQTRAAFRASGKVEWLAPCVVGARMNFKNQGLGNCSFAPNVEIRHRAWHARSDSTPLNNTYLWMTDPNMLLLCNATRFLCASTLQYYHLNHA
jgi:hypothetical protein